MRCENDQVEERAAVKDREQCLMAYEGYVCVCIIWCLALGERLGMTLNATTGLLEVITVDANSKLIVVMV